MGILWCWELDARAAAGPLTLLRCSEPPPGGVPTGDTFSTLSWILLRSFFSPTSVKLVGLAVPSLGKGGDNQSQLRGGFPAAWPWVTPLPRAGQCGCQMVHLGPGKKLNLAEVGRKQCCFGRTRAAVVPFGVQFVALALLSRARHDCSTAQR